MTERQTVDASASSVLAVCSCGWREIVTTREQAWTANYRHAERAHSGDNSDTTRRMMGKYL